MNNFTFSLEIIIIGFVVVMVALFVLALILLAFNKVLGTAGKKGKKIIIEAVGSQKPPGKIKEPDKQAIAGAQQAVASGLPGGVRPEIAAALTGVLQSMTARPELVAAAMGALLYASEAPVSKLDKKRTRPHPLKTLWKETGRTKIVHLRQDFLLFRRRYLDAKIQSLCKRPTI